jgi:hypothetical protein
MRDNQRQEVVRDQDDIGAEARGQCQRFFFPLPQSVIVQVIKFVPDVSSLREMYVAFTDQARSF